MSATLKKLLLLSLALVLSFTLVAFVGCKALPQEEMDQIIADAVAAGYYTVSFDMDFPMTITAEGGSDPGTMTADTSGTGAIDTISQAMRMTLTMAIGAPGTESQNVSAEIYVVEGWMYTGASITDEGMQWAKMALTEPLWQQQDQVGQYAELLATAVEVKYKGTETVNGVECYVFELEPDMDTLGDLLVTVTSSLGLVNLSGLDLAALYQELSVKEWLAKDSHLLQRTEIEIVMEISPEDVGATSDDFEKMTMDIGMTMRFYAYDQPFTVVLPPEALAAEEVTIP
ncbi:MAG: hypothetical protein MUO17_00710 [Dehalococcoidales bacterium]|nr:hypothetical protein [Dehalococcoidales bacterium]